ncbi:hypothetical protein [Paenibacillus odorifer]|uniref:hypothetical protein n=1 Tax=Paenibacillus odorifer TaxID=189426 RepID=UPI0020BD7A43|nr:hypothetical protein [Paenibacillus odorifer]
MLVEVKFYSQEIQKDKIRAYIGVIKDISENYIVQTSEDVRTQIRYTDIGAFFSASGFQDEAISLAYAHGIKTISYKNNLAIKEIIEQVKVLELLLRYSKTVGKNKQVTFMVELEKVLSKSMSIDDFSNKYDLLDDGKQQINDLSDLLLKIETSFFGMNHQGIMLHFLSMEKFPDELFAQTDEQECMVYYVVSQGDSVNAWITFTADKDDRKYYFDAPPGLLDIILTGQDVISIKEVMFERLTVFISIGNILRTLSIRISKDRLKDLRNIQKEH